MKISTVQLRGLILEEISKMIDEAKTNHPAQYKAPPGSKRAAQLDQTQDDLEQAEKLKNKDPKRSRELKQRAYNRRARMEENDATPESIETLRSLIIDVITEALSKKTKATLRKKAEERGLTPSSVEAEYKKGLAAWATSGSRPGVSQHAWAMARVNSATPSKSWATVKKSKKKKKK